MPPLIPKNRIWAVGALLACVLIVAALLAAAPDLDWLTVVVLDTNR